MNKYDPFKRLAIKALQRYSINVIDISFLVEETNIFFVIDSTDGKYVLKVFQEESSKLEDNLLEVLLLKEVSLRTNIVVPKIVESIEGDAILFVTTDEFDIQKRVAVYQFMEGVDFHERETDALFVRVGSLMAHLHNATRQIEYPQGIIPKRWDKVFYYRDEEIYYHSEPYRSFFSEEDIAFLDQFIKYLDHKLPNYYEQESFLIHADMNPWNIKLYNDDIRLLDFEEGMEGTVLHELAIFMFYYRFDDNYNYEHMKDLVFQGYQTIAPLPEITDFDLDLLIMARYTNFINYVLILYDDPSEYITERIRRLKEFVSNYQIELLD